MALASLIVKIGADITDLNKGMNDADKGVQRLGKKLQGVGRALSTAITVPIVAIGAASVKMASDAEEAANKFDVVMGPAAARMRDQLTTLADTIPLAQHEMEGLAAGIQDMLVPMGVARDKGAEMSVGFVELAGDMAAFSNQSPQQVLQDIQSALAGSSEPMRKYGVDTREAALKAIALEEGLIKEGEALDSTKRAMALMLQVQKDTTDATGAAAREAENAGQQMKFLMTNAKELGVTIGNVLLPVVTPMLQKFNDGLKIFQDLSPDMQKVVVVVGGLAAAVGPLLLGVGTLMKFLPLLKVGFAVLTGPVGLVAAAVVGLAVVWMKWGDDIKRVVGDVVGSVKGWFDSTLVPAIDAVKPIVTALATRFRENFDTIVGAVRSGVEFVGGFLRGLSPTFEAVKGFVGGLWNMFEASFKLIGAIVEVTAGAIANVLEAVLGPPLMWLKDNVLPPLGKAFEFFGDVAVKVIQGMVDISAGLINTFIGGPLKKLTGGIEMVTGAFEWMYDKVVGNSYVPDMIAAIQAEFGTLQSVMVSPAMTATEQVSASFQQLDAEVRSAGASMMESMRQTTAGFSDETVRRIEMHREQVEAAKAQRDEFERLGGTLEKVSTRSVKAGETMRGGLLGVFDSISNGLGGLMGQFDGWLGKLGGVGDAISKLIGGAGSSGIMGKITGAISGLIPGGSIVNAIAGPLINKAVGAVGKGVVNLGKKFTGFLGFADGGMHSGGLRLVGERGPELEVTGPSRIYSHSQTKDMLGGGNDAMVRVNQAGFQAVISELKAMRAESYELRHEVRRLQGVLV